MTLRKYLLTVAIFLAGCLCGCTDDVMENSISRDPEHPMAVAFTAERLDNGTMTRAGAKASFNVGDVIQVSAVFSRGGNRIGTQYTCLEYNAAGEWVTGKTTTTMLWPIDAESGEFTAYYIPAAKGILEPDKPMEPVLLETLTDETDPLRADCKGVEYGRAVNLQFRHLCTRLILQHVKTDYADEYWLTSSLHKTDMPNAYQLTLSDDTLKFEFLTKGDFTEETPVKIARTKTDNEVVFYLAPGNYDKMLLNYSYYRPYLQFDASKDEALKKVITNLQEHNSYIIDVSKLLGIVNIEDNPQWHDPEKEEPIKLGDHEIVPFLDAIAKGDDYFKVNEDQSLGEQLLSGDGQTVTLLENVSFNNANGGSLGSVPNAIRLNGNYHYITDLAGPLFKTIQGNVYDLGIYQVNFQCEYETSTTINDQDINSFGALSKRSSGNVSGIRLERTTVTFTDDGTHPTIAFNVGALIGDNQGAINDVTLGGAVEVNAKNNTIGTLSLGGVLGQNNGSLTKVSFKDDSSSLNVANGIEGSGELFTGGIIGLSSGDDVVSNTIITVTVDAEGSAGILNYTGGIVGNLRSGTIKDCAISGMCRGGLGNKLADATADAMAYTGGLAGALGRGQITGCTAFNQVSAAGKISYSDGVANAIGGAVGGLTQNSKETVVASCRIWNEPVENEYTGWLLGMGASNFLGDLGVDPVTGADSNIGPAGTSMEKIGHEVKFEN